jgi:hypothetical protein
MRHPFFVCRPLNAFCSRLGVTSHGHSFATLDGHDVVSGAFDYGAIWFIRANGLRVKSVAPPHWP